MTQGVVQTLGERGRARAPGVRADDRARPGRSQIAIKQLGTNGGGFFNVNSAHPFEGGDAAGELRREDLHPVDPGGAHLHVREDGRQRQAGLDDLRGDVGPDGRRARGHGARGAPRDAGDAEGRRVRPPPPNMEGKEVRYGPDASSLWAVATTDASNGSVNSMHDSYNALGMLAPMFNLGVGEVIWGGVGSGLYGMIFYVIIAVFIGGLMVGPNPRVPGEEDPGPRGEALGDRRAGPVPRRPRLHRDRGGDAEYRRGGAELGAARLQRDLLRVPLAREQQRLGVRRPDRERAVLRDRRRHRDAGLRFVPLLARSRWRGASESSGPCRSRPGTLRTDTPLFGGLLTGVIVVIGALTFLPASRSDPSSRA